MKRGRRQSYEKNGQEEEGESKSLKRNGGNESVLQN